MLYNIDTALYSMSDYVKFQSAGVKNTIQTEQIDEIEFLFFINTSVTFFLNIFCR